MQYSFYILFVRFIYMYYLIFSSSLSSTFLSNTYANLTILTDFIFYVILLSKETGYLLFREEMYYVDKKAKAGH